MCNEGMDFFPLESCCGIQCALGKGLMCYMNDNILCCYYLLKNTSDLVRSEMMLFRFAL